MLKGQDFVLWRSKWARYTSKRWEKYWKKRKLTNKVIDNLQVYYDKAIMQGLHLWNKRYGKCCNGDMVSYKVDGIKSWPQAVPCWWNQRDLAKNTFEYIHKHSFAESVSAGIFTAYFQWPKQEAAVISSCLHGGMQNQNDSFNALIWQRASKQTHSTLSAIELATHLAVRSFNDGAKTTCLGISWN